jgi:epoxyqueuosine reductase
MARNAAIVLGNRRNPGDLDRLHQAILTDDEALVRSHAAWALGEIGGETAEAVLRLAAAAERNLDVQAEIAHALTRIAARPRPSPPRRG